MLKKIILSMLSLFIFCGCSSSISKTSVSQEIHDLEETHIASDYSLIFQQYDLSTMASAKLYSENLPVDEYNKKLAIIISNSMENLYMICLNRINQDMDLLYQYSDTYIDYIAYLSTYADFYNEDNDTLKELLKIGDISSIKELNSYKYADMMLIEALETVSGN
ncbi:hypothetical protein ACR75C_05920 [Thomasclavelia ramosa]|uniref:hypothetical protein n=1 Tax=Thomasclavelia ramosa TaxID=1547 RepID=UPI003DA5360E